MFKLSHIFEALHVPENLHNVSDAILDIFIKRIQNKNNTQPFQIEEDVNLEISGKKIKKIYVDCTIEIRPDIINTIKKPFILAQAASLGDTTPLSSIPGKKTMIGKTNIAPNEGAFQIHYIINPNSEDIKTNKYPPKWLGLEKYLNDNNDELIHLGSILSHEFMHHFDADIRTSVQGEKPENLIDYTATQETSSDNIIQNLDNLREFFHLRYFISNVENVVRPSEFDYVIKKKKVPRDMFLKHLYEKDAFQTLLKAKKLNYDSLINGIINDPFFRVLTLTNNITKEEGLRQVLRHCYIIYANEYRKGVIYVFAKNDDTKLQDLLNNKYPDKDIQNKFNNIRRNIDIYLGNPELWFRNEINRINKEADKVIRKVGSIYGGIQ